MDPARADWSSRWFNREEEVERIKAGPDADGWDERDRAMLRAADELNSDFFISEPNSKALSFFTEKQKVDLVMSVGQHAQVSMMLYSFGVQLAEGRALDVR